METVILWGVLLGLVALVLGFSFYRMYRVNMATKARIAAEYGQTPVWKLDERDYASMKRYHEQRPPGSEGIDDITWADLNMDAVFKRMKNTQSSIGDEYTYRFFRRQQNGDLARFEQAVQALHSADKERKQLQFAFHKIGRKTNNGLVDLLLHPDRFPKIPLAAIVVMTLLGIGALVWMAVDIDYGILAVCLCFCAALILFMVVLRKIYVAVSTLGMFTRMVRAGKLLVKLNLPALQPETQRVAQSLKVFKNVNELADVIIHSSSSNSMLMILVSYFGLYGFAYQALANQFRRHPAEAMALYEDIGYVELCISTASWRQSVEAYCNPTFTEGTEIEFEDIVHPLLKAPVPNTHKMGNKVLITGSNASGKSTFARTLAVNAVLGQLFNTCLAKKYVFRPCAVYTSMNLKDDITTGDSFYVAEVKSLKRLLAVAGGAEYTMLFLDEIFKGTNMVERIAAASVILKQFAGEDCFICLSTHDLELCRMMGSRYGNYHFEEVIEGNDIYFDYKLRDGITTGSNAIKLLAYCEYDPALVQQAEAVAQNYRQAGEWEVL